MPNAYFKTTVQLIILVNKILTILILLKLQTNIIQKSMTRIIAAKSIYLTILVKKHY